MINLIQIETTALCNARCLFCPHKDLKRPLGVMEWDLFVEIIKQVKELGVHKICPFLNGDPFTDPLLFKMLEYINKELPDVKLDIFTNMALLLPDKLTKLSKIKNIETFFMSLTSHNKASALKYMGLEFDTVYTNVVNFLKLNHELHFVKSVQSSSLDTNTYANQKYLECWRAVGLEKHFIARKENWLGNIESGSSINSQVVCPRTSHLCVYWEGTVPLCCFDADGYKTFGNIADKKLIDIYNSEEYKKYRTTIKAKLDPCRRCTV